MILPRSYIWLRLFHGRRGAGLSFRTEHKPDPARGGNRPEHHPGLTCDPICGPVQVPCMERSADAAHRAIDACSPAGFPGDTQRISFGIVVRTMCETGISMNQRFRETAEGGLAGMFERRRR